MYVFENLPNELPDKFLERILLRSKVPIHIFKLPFKNGRVVLIFPSTNTF